MIDEVKILRFFGNLDHSNRIKIMENLKVGFILFENLGGKKDAASSRIRGKWLVKYWPEAEIFIQGAKYDVVIFQKTYWIEYAKAFKGIKILDLCDPDWMDGMPILEMLENVDAVTCSSPALTDYIKQLTKKPVLYMPDRHDLQFHNKQKKHKGVARSVVWFGYSGNTATLKGTENILKKGNLELTVISDMRPPYKYADKNVKWDLETVNDEILMCDIVLMPKCEKGRFKYKSNNKITKAWALGMPVATNPDELIKFLDPKERQKEAELRLNEVREKYDVKQSVQEMKNLIDQCIKTK